MALTTEDLEQIRSVVRSELQQPRRGFADLIFASLKVLACIFAVVLALHILVIGGFTIYHLIGH